MEIEFNWKLSWSRDWISKLAITFIGRILYFAIYFLRYPQLKISIEFHRLKLTVWINWLKNEKKLYEKRRKFIKTSERIKIRTIEYFSHPSKDITWIWMNYLCLILSQKRLQNVVHLDGFIDIKTDCHRRRVGGWNISQYLKSFPAFISSNHTYTKAIQICSVKQKRR